MKAEDLKAYSEGFKKRVARADLENKERKEAAWKECRRVVALLREKADPERVILFGSLARDEFDHNSDLDLAVYGLSLSAYNKAYADIDGLCGKFSIDLIRAEDMSTGFRRIVEESGVILYDRARKENH